MKKIILLLTITCASALNGMEPETEHIYQLPNELQTEITRTAILSNDNLADAIATIKYLNASGVPYDILFKDITDFTKLVHILGNRFGLETEYIAVQFNSLVAKEYFDLSNKLRKAIKAGNIPEIEQLIAQHADINYQYHAPEYKSTTSLLIYATRNSQSKIVQLLLNAGADPNFKDSQGKTALDYNNEQIQWYKNAYEGKAGCNEATMNNLMYINQMLKKAMKKQ